MAAAVTGSVQLQSHVFRNPSDFRDVEATPFARRSTHRIEHKDDCEYSKWYDATARWQPRQLAISAYPDAVLSCGGDHRIRCRPCLVRNCARGAGAHNPGRGS